MTPLGPVMIGIDGLALTADSRERLRHPAVGGVVLFSRNYGDRRQLEALVDDIRSSRDERLLIAIDQEGGRVQRLRESFTALPPLAAVGRLYETDPSQACDMAWRHGRVMATEMLAFGIDLSFAPVLDLAGVSGVIGDRALAASPRTVVALGRHYLAGMHDAGMKTCGKHFPGHGSVRADSHVADVFDDRPLEALRESDMVPFVQLHDQLDSMMVAHVVYTAVDPLPAGYSRRWLRDILRDNIGYRGVVISDDLGMHAAAVGGDVDERVGRCLEAGCDVVLVCQPEDVGELLSGDGPDLPPGSREAAPVAVGRLYGRPDCGPADLESLKRQGVGEWDQWCRSLESLE